jgi:hypothetical protein
MTVPISIQARMYKADSLIRLGQAEDAQQSLNRSSYIRPPCVCYFLNDPQIFRILFVVNQQAVDIDDLLMPLFQHTY